MGQSVQERVMTGIGFVVVFYLNYYLEFGPPSAKHRGGFVADCDLGFKAGAFAGILLSC
jgi:hypothetical protein